MSPRGSGAGAPALLVLEDGTTCWGTSVGAPGETFGELVFNTGMTGYQEVLTDPSYRGQIVLMTYPEIGIYGVNDEDTESGRVQVAGFVMHRAVRQPFNQRATGSLCDYLVQAGVVALEGVDTRALTRHIRSQGAMRAAISTTDLVPQSLLERVRKSPSMVGRNLVRELEPEGVLGLAADPAAGAGAHVVLVDAGSKANIARELARRGARLTTVPYDATIGRVLGEAPDGVLISNGPGDPAALEETVRLMRGLLERGVPLAGICLGHQLLGLALGGMTYKMRFGHRGSNHPVKDLGTGRVLITTQNHGFAVDPTSLDISWAPLDAAYVAGRPERLAGQGGELGQVTMAELLPSGPLAGSSPLGFGPVQVTHLSLNDGTLEGLCLLDPRGDGRPLAISVQYHPEASPGPHDGGDFFDGFLTLVRGETHPLSGEGRGGTHAAAS